MSDVINNVPVIALSGMTIFPYMVIHFDVNRKKTINAVEYAMLHGQKLFCTVIASEENDAPGEKHCMIGTFAEIHQIMRLPNNVVRVNVRGISRGRILAETDGEKMQSADIELLSEVDFSNTAEIEQAAMLRTIKERVVTLAKENPRLNKESVSRVLNTEKIDTLVYRIASELILDQKVKQTILECDDGYELYDIVMTALAREIDIEKIRKEMTFKVKESVDKHQKEYVLREQMRLINAELGESEESEADEFKRMTDELNASDEVKNKLYKEIKRYRNLSGSSSEGNVVRTYIETLLEMPWENESEDNNDIKNAIEILDKDHYGLEKVKERVVEYLSVRSVKKDANASVICLVGPPGTGKTSIASSIARALEKKYVRVCLGGVRDEAEIRGHRKTYVGAMPGRIVDAIRQAGVKNPLILFDEIDKTGTDSRGDTASALLEVLDFEQNRRFMDHYMEVPIDLSKVLFICTANDASKIPRPLFDRMEIIELNSYTENEKFHIAKDYLVKKQIQANGLTGKEISISDTAIMDIIRSYTREAGVRNLERTIGSLCRKVLKKRLVGELPGDKVTRVSGKNLSDFLGKPKYKEEKASKKAEVGSVCGLAWTSVGGDTLSIEVNTMPGKGNLILTGNLGDVMKESARIALTYVRSVASDYGVKKDFFEKNDIHVHIPEGAVPKDGPSAGITMTTAILSAVSKRKIRAGLAMTGEVTLRGKVLAIGGLKEKLLAAGAYGITDVLVPEKNKSDVEELSKEITEPLNIRYVSSMDEVLEFALV